MEENGKKGIVSLGYTEDVEKHYNLKASKRRSNSPKAWFGSTDCVGDY